MSVSKPSYEAVYEAEHSFRYLAHGADSSLVRWHYHNEYELHLIQSTRGNAFIGDYVGPFEPGTVFLCGPYLPHNWVSLADFQSGIRDRVINFSDERMCSLADCLPEMRAMKTMLADSRYGIEFSPDASRKVADAFTDVARLKGMPRVLKFLEIMTTLAESGDYRTLSERSFEDESDSLIEERVSIVVNHIMEHCTTDLHLDDVAGLLGLTPSFFSRWFRKTTGYRFIDFVTRLRISRACEQLEASDKPITNICFEAGFSNVANFNRHFLKIKGMTPRQYRESLDIRGRRTPIMVSLRR
ncbi:AraC family transcriptional regulator [Saccharospirillum salsuginis]|uniref:Transcriptional regulator MtlR n=1 Tax=Saccharospirillum salsuginis TaxID=418750 RepID=A0A918KLY1_9GAMM|nr:helix-turn-helix domain-containing protein [Saccharospirillum salsuginis]GGX67526.1 transcriptional regulator MtlR [Saccharospirillum salsuginis]